jgi:predicted phage terminase large subunit-like protein
LFASYGKELVTRDSNKTRQLIKSQWYADRFCANWKIREDEDGKTKFANTEGGIRMIMSPDSGGTGFRGDAVIFDDPLRADEAHSSNSRERVIRWKTETMSNRFNDMSTATEVIIMQRLHDNDMAGYLLRAGGYQHLCLPAEYESARKSKTYTNDGKLFWEDPRTEEGELLFPAKFPREVLERMKGPQGVGTYGYAGQYQQRPVPAGGGIIKREWFKHRYLEYPECEEYIIAVDAGFKKTEDSDRVAVQVWGRKGGKAYFLDTDWRQMGFVDTVNSIKTMKARWPQVGAIYIEDKANGSAVIEVLKNSIPGIIPLQPDGGKEARISSITKFLEAGNIVIPEDKPWANSFVDEACAFPKGTNDDAIDCAAYAIKNILMSSSLIWLEKIAKW